MGRKTIPRQTPEAETLLKIKLARHRINLSQGDVAKALGIAQQTWSQYERGVATLGFDILLKLPAILETSIADLLPSSVVTAVDQRRSKDPHLEEIILGWNDLTPEHQQHILLTYRLVADVARVGLRRSSVAAKDASKPPKSPGQQ